MTVHRLSGLRDAPMSSYLCGLGLIRVVGAQADPDLTAWWDDNLALSTSVDDLAGWLVESYAPTPVLSPWNKDGLPRAALDRLCALPDARFDGLRDATAAVEEVLADPPGDGKDAKAALVRQLRGWCPPQMLPWLDAAVVLTGDGPQYPPLLGTGGNDGRLEFARTFLDQLWLVLAPGAAAAARQWAADLFAGAQTQRLQGVSVGQFNPGAAGGKNSSPHGEAGSLVNPWEYVLMVEGAMLFAAGVARRHGLQDARVAVPFTVDASPHASDSGADDESSRGEVWAPMWTEPFSYPEIRQLFGEARTSWRGRPVRRAVDFYQACVTHGVSRGLSHFTRYGLHERNGRAYLAVPLDRVTVEERPAVTLAGPVQRWVSRLPGSVPAAVRLAVRRFEAAQVAFAKDTTAEGLRRLLAARTGVEVAVARSGQLRTKVKPQRCPAARPYLDFLVRSRATDSPALRIALGIVSARRRGEPHALRHLLLPVSTDDRDWTDNPIVLGFDSRGLPAALADVLAWRSRVAPEAAQPDSRQPYRGVAPLTDGIAVPAADLHRWVLSASGVVPDPDVSTDAVGEWLPALLALDWSRVDHRWASTPDLTVLDPTLGLLAALAAGEVGRSASEEARPTIGTGWARQLIAGRTIDVHRAAAARLRQCGWWAVPHRTAGIEPDAGPLLTAALTTRCHKPIDVLRRLAQPLTTDNSDEKGSQT